MSEILFEVTSTQPIADMLKALVSTVRPADMVEARLRRHALRLIRLFEGEIWSPQLFVYALEAQSFGTFTFAPVGAMYTPDKFSDNPPGDLLSDIVDALTEYLTQLNPARWERRDAVFLKEATFE